MKPFWSKPVGFCGYYERIETLKAQNEIALALDEKPNIQALQRSHPTQPMRAGQIERHEFEYVRHGVVNFLALLNLYNGKMRSCCLEKNDSEPLCKSLPTLLQPFHAFNRVHLIWDGGPSHVSAATNSFLKSHYGNWLRVVVTPAHRNTIDYGLNRSIGRGHVATFVSGLRKNSQDYVKLLFIHTTRV